MRWSWRIAATVAVVAFVAVLTLVLQRDRSLTTVTVAQGETQLIELADGSTVRLLGGSSLTYADPAKATSFNRRVTLAGRAFFDIAPDQQGFTVEKPPALATVLGTSFGIQAEALEWTGLFLFRSTPLSDAVARLSRRYGVDIAVSPDLEAEGVSGTFAREQSLQQILDALATTLNAAVQGNDADGYTMAPAGQ